MSESIYNPLQGRVVGLVERVHHIANIKDEIRRAEAEERAARDRIASLQADLMAEENRLHNKRDELLDLLADPEPDPEPEQGEEREEFESLVGVEPGWYVPKSPPENPLEVYRIYVSGYTRRFSRRSGVVDVATGGRLMDPDFYDVESPFVRVEKPDWVGEERE